MSNIELKVVLSAVEYKALAHVCVSPREWIENIAKVRSQTAIDDIYKKEVERMMEDPSITTIPANKETIVMNASILTGKQLNEQEQGNPPL